MLFNLHINKNACWRYIAVTQQEITVNNKPLPNDKSFPLDQDEKRTSNEFELDFSIESKTSNEALMTMALLLHQCS